MKLALASLAALAVACGGGKKADTGPSTSGESDAAMTTDRDGGAGGADSLGAAHAGPPSEAECDALLDHLLALRVESMAGDRPPEAVPTDEDVDAIRTSMRPEFLPYCLTMTRERYACARAATTRDAMAACDEIP